MRSKLEQPFQQRFLGDWILLHKEHSATSTFEGNKSIFNNEQAKKILIRIFFSQQFRKQNFFFQIAVLSP